MAFPTPTELKTMDMAFKAQPFVYVASKVSVTLAEMDVAYQAQPFVANESSEVGDLDINIYDAISITEDIVLHDIIIDVPVVYDEASLSEDINLLLEYNLNVFDSISITEDAELLDLEPALNIEKFDLINEYFGDVIE